MNFFTLIISMYTIIFILLHKAIRLPIILRFSFCRFFTRYCMFGIPAFCCHNSVLLRPRAYEEFGSSGSSLSCDESVFCCTWLPSVECAASSHEDTWALFVSAVRKMVCGVNASNWVIIYCVKLLDIMLDIMTVCCWGFLM
jgi:hypothetical protein